jgi:hypothetical protein
MAQKLFVGGLKPSDRSGGPRRDGGSSRDRGAGGAGRGGRW